MAERPLAARPTPSNVGVSRRPKRAVSRIAATPGAAVNARCTRPSWSSVEAWLTAAVRRRSDRGCGPPGLREDHEHRRAVRVVELHLADLLLVATYREDRLQVVERHPVRRLVQPAAERPALEILGVLVHVQGERPSLELRGRGRAEAVDEVVTRLEHALVVEVRPEEEPRRDAADVAQRRARIVLVVEDPAPEDEVIGQLGRREELVEVAELEVRLP